MAENFETVKTLPVNIYKYRFVVDGYLTYAPELPWAFDDSGHGYNILDLMVISCPHIFVLLHIFVFVMF